MKLRCNEYFPEGDIDNIENFSMDVFRTGFARSVQVSILRSLKDIGVCSPRSVYNTDGYDYELYAEGKIFTLPEPNPEPNPEQKPSVVEPRKRKSEEAAINRTDEVYANGTLKMAKPTENRKRHQGVQPDEQSKRARENEETVIAIVSCTIPQRAELKLSPTPTPEDFPGLLQHRTINQSVVGSRKRALSKDDSEIIRSEIIQAAKRCKTKFDIPEQIRKRRHSRADPESPETKRRGVDQMASWAAPPDYSDMAATIEDFCYRLASFSIEWKLFHKRSAISYVAMNMLRNFCWSRVDLAQVL